jgi:hypothetical protein
MAKFKLLKPRMRNIRSRVPLMEIDETAMMSPERAERKTMYTSDRWVKLRRQMLEKKCWYGCGRYATTLDHLLGHDDGQAMRCAMALRVPADPDWQRRFWSGPFISLCNECHSAKTRQEAAGRLLDWLKAKRDIKG